MKLLSPVNSFKSSEAQIASGADEIYVGLKTDIFKRYSFSGRGQSSKACPTTVPDKEELKDIVNIAHNNNVEVSLTANVAMFSDGLDPQSKVDSDYIKYVETGLSCGIDNIIVGDIGLIYKLGRMNLPANLHASTFMDTMNVEQMLLLKELGVKRCILTYQIGFEEIKILCQQKFMEIEVFGYLSCSFFNGACNLVHDMGEVNENEEILIGVPCKSEYRVYEEGRVDKVLPFFDAELGCALCSLKMLNDIGVNVIKIAGRDRNYEMIAKITKQFKQALSTAESSQTNEEYLEKINRTKYKWWERIWCAKKCCKYKNNDITNSYIGYQ